MARKTETHAAIHASGPPAVEALLAQTLETWRRKHSLPPEMPQSVDAAVAWWLAHQEPPTRRDAPRRLPIPATDGAWRWECPYHERVNHNLRIFLSAEAALRTLVVAAHEDGIYWHGEPYEQLCAYVAETFRMREIGVATYRGEVAQRARGVIRALEAAPHDD